MMVLYRDSQRLHEIEGGKEGEEWFYWGILGLLIEYSVDRLYIASLAGGFEGGGKGVVVSIVHLPSRRFEFGDQPRPQGSFVHFVRLQEKRLHARYDICLEVLNGA